MSFIKYPKNYHANGYGWHNMAAMGYAKPPSPSKECNFSPKIGSSVYPQSLNMPMPGGQFGGGAIGMPPLPNSTYGQSQPTGVQLSYGFSTNILPAQVPNAVRADSVDIGPGIGWNIGGHSNSRSQGSSSFDGGVRDELAIAQVEKPCEAVYVPDEDMPIYSFGYPSVSEIQ